MRQASLKFKMYSSSVSIVNNDNLNAKVFSLILWSFAALAVCYVLILGNTVFNIVERKSLESTARTLTNEMGDLEVKYISLSGKIDPTLGTTLGFKEAKTKQFVTRKSLGSLGGVKVAQNEL